MIDPVLGRLIAFHGPPLANPLHYQLITYGLTDVILLALLWRPPLVPRQRRAFAAGAVAFPLAHLGWFTLAQGPLWLPFAAWFRAL